MTEQTGVSKNYNKTILQTSITSLEGIYYLLNVVKENQPVTSEQGKSTVFPTARARVSQERGGEWSEDKRDTHAELTLREMRFIRYLPNTPDTFEVSDIGYEFLSAFSLNEIPDEGGKVKLELNDELSLEDRNQFLFDVLMRIEVRQERFGRRNHPYRILFKLLADPDLGGYLSKSDWARFINESAFLFDTQYDDIKKAILNVREADETIPPMKSDRVLTRLVLWKVLDRVDIPYEDELCFGFNPEFAKTVYTNMITGENPQSVQQTEEPEPQEIDYDTYERLTDGTNTLLYGVPGSGKSWTIEHEYCPKGSVVERLVFHPDYTNADFIGQILPVVDKDKQVTYEFTAGPFTSILREAWIHPDVPYILVIEEINRGNAPAIFGEVFQLLDRKVAVHQQNDDGLPIGTSEYGVTNANMALYIYHDAKHKVRIPSNLSILGTMNTSDQNVFTLDTAFQRRWHMRLIENNFDNVRSALKNAKILDTGITWQRFCEVVNSIIIGNKNKMASAEDKRLGVYFVHENDLVYDPNASSTIPGQMLLTEYNALLSKETEGTISDEEQTRLSDIRKAVTKIRRFPEKVIKYLWDDAFKFNLEALFDTENMDSLEKVIRTFVFNSEGPERFKVFKQNVRSQLLQ